MKRALALLALLVASVAQAQDTKGWVLIQLKVDNPTVWGAELTVDKCKWGMIVQEIGKAPDFGYRESFVADLSYTNQDRWLAQEVDFSRDIWIYLGTMKRLKVDNDKDGKIDDEIIQQTFSYHTRVKDPQSPPEIVATVPSTFIGFLPASEWDGHWLRVVQVYVGSEPPANPRAGDLYWRVGSGL